MTEEAKPSKKFFVLAGDDSTFVHVTTQDKRPKQYNTYQEAMDAAKLQAARFPEVEYIIYSPSTCVIVYLPPATITEL